MEGLTHRQSVTTSLWEAPKMKKPTMPMEVIEEKDTKETTTVGVQELGETANQEMKTETPNFESGLTYDPPVNLNAKTTIIHDDSEDKADEAGNKAKSIPSKQTKLDPPPLKAYKPKIP
ncbi:hypothetical protein Tco_0160253, partial [Tanacetum coccineum]